MTYLSGYYIVRTIDDKGLPFEWITESLIQPIHSQTPIHSGKAVYRIWMNHWTIHSNDSFFYSGTTHYYVCCSTRSILLWYFHWRSKYCVKNVSYLMFFHLIKNTTLNVCNIAFTTPFQHHRMGFCIYYLAYSLYYAVVTFETFVKKKVWKCSNWTKLNQKWGNVTRHASFTPNSQSRGFLLLLRIFATQM